MDYSDQRRLLRDFAKCTHLGCTTRWLKTEQKFKCPCHGSDYYISGLNFEGPAPRPMDRFNSSIADDGQLEVGKSSIFTMEPGNRSERAVPSEHT
ncbi:ubiquinol-cytochrome c reductase iron-sulfur subunit [Candidatus Binatus sp.]|uniref:QcrA and Rieske domain-containing protein n=1 Tax=Candidatus Binatus sp. TaxID=2811406 RepID=UPI003BB04412